MARRDAVEVAFGDAENRGYRFQIGEFRFVDGAVRLGDVEQAVEHVFQELRLVPESVSKLPGIGFEAVVVALARSKRRVTRACAESGTSMMRSKASTSERVTTPSDFAILAASATSPVVNTRSFGMGRNTASCAVHQHMACEAAEQGSDRSANREA